MTTTAVQKKTDTVPQRASPLTALATRFQIEPAKLLEVLRGTVIKPDKNGRAASNEEVAAFCIVADQYKLNPFTREIHAFTSGDKGVVPIVGIDGWTHIVNQSDGFNGCEFDEVQDDKGAPVSITCKMYVKGREHPVCATERFAECKRGTIPWNTMPWRMLRHKAYMQAARYAFGLSGIYDEDEARDIVSRPTSREPIAEPTALPPAVDVESTVKTDQPATATDKPADLPPDPLPANTVTGIAEQISVKPTKKGGNRYSVLISGEWYSTFDDKLGRIAEGLRGAEVTAEYVVDGEYRNLTAIAAA